MEMCRPSDMAPLGNEAMPLHEWHSGSERVQLNVGGRSIRLRKERLESAGGLLARFAARGHSERLLQCDDYLPASAEYYFERSPVIFDHIADFYFNGSLHRPSDVCPKRFNAELDFWQIPHDSVSNCCRLYEKRDDEKEKWNNGTVSAAAAEQEALFDRVCLGRGRRLIWTFLEHPRSSLAAKTFSLISASFVLLSLIVLIVGSMPEFQDKDMEPQWALQWLEAICMIWFSAEYVLRLAVNPKKTVFVREALNVIDLLTILPFWAESCLPLIGVRIAELRNLRGAMIVMRVLRVARVGRIFKLARYSTGLRAFGQTMGRSIPELSMLGMFLLTGIILFSTAIYFFERDEPRSRFNSIPAACWWCVITMTTVGYGDLVPATAGGKTVAALASVCGIIVLAFPISMIIDKFAESTGGWANFDRDDRDGQRRISGKKRRTVRRHVF